MRKQYQALGRKAGGGPNRTEAAYGRYLDQRRMAGEIISYRFEPLSLRLGNNTFYHPDYMVMNADREIEFHEVKGGGYWTDDSRVKIKVAASLFPEFKFLGIASPSWKIEEF